MIIDTLALMLVEGPGNMLAHQGRSVITAGVQGVYDGGVARCIPQGDGYIAQPALIADAADGRACGALQKLILAPGEYLDEQGGIETMAG